MSEDPVPALVPAQPTMAYALRALNLLIAAARPDADVTHAAQTIATYLSQRTSGHPENTGLPCPYCQEKLPSLSIDFSGPLVQVRIAKAMPLSEVVAFATFLRQTAEGR